MARSTERKDSFLSVYGYTDYRKYLDDFYTFKKNGPKGYSFRSFSKIAGFSSPNILKLVMTGQRNLSSSSVEKFLKALGLKGKMADYFRVLVKLNQATGVEEKTNFYDELTRLTPVSRRRDLDTAAMEYLSHWLFPVLREMALLPYFKDDPYWISRRLVGQASVREISHALKFLIDQEFIMKDDAGVYKAKDNMVLSTDEVKSLAIRRYHKKILEQATETLESLPMEEREFGALTFMLPEGAFEELKLRLKEFRKGIHKWAVETGTSSEDSGHVVQVNIQMYPQTKKEAQ